MPIIDQSSEAMNMSNEPVRLAGWVALLVGAALVSVLLWSTGAGYQQIIAVVALMALTEIGGLEWARKHVTPVSNPSLPTIDFVPGDEDV